MEVIRLLAPSQGYDKGMTVDKIASHIYGQADFQTKAKARQLIGGARKALARQGFPVDLYSVKPVGMPERRYCHLSSIAEYTRVINDFERHVEGRLKTKKELEEQKVTVPQRVKLKEVIKARAKESKK